MQKPNGFTLIELLVTITIVAVLSAIILFSIVQYINRSKDGSIAGNLSVLIPAGEVWYDHNNNNGYIGFLSSEVAENSFSQITSEKHYNESANAWVACAQEFVNNEKAFCVDSRGIKKEIDISVCRQDIGGQTITNCSP